MPAKYKGEAVQCIKQAKEDDDLFLFIIRANNGRSSTTTYNITTVAVGAKWQSR